MGLALDRSFINLRLGYLYHIKSNMIECVNLGRIFSSGDRRIQTSNWHKLLFDPHDIVKDASKAPISIIIQITY